MRNFAIKDALWCGLAVVAVLVLHFSAVYVDTKLMETYHSFASRVTYDRTGEVVQVALNDREQFCLFASNYPEHVRALVLQKEDQWFQYHFGINPGRIIAVIWGRIQVRKEGGASTITQQLAKILLGTAHERTVGNKIREVAIAFVLEYRHTKEQLLTMYLNTVPLGGNIEGFPAASRAYFNKQVNELNENEVLQLTSALSNPSVARPLSETNFGRSQILASALNTVAPLPITAQNESRESGVWLELTDVLKDCPDCTSTIDANLNERIRHLASLHVARGKEYGFSHVAVVVIDAKTAEVLALVGSPAPNENTAGNKINMALATRPIGSTIKPFLYVLGFMHGLRPYSLVEDREYKFEIETGFPLYPKNYDGQYRGIVTLEEALANSLNVPTVSVLRYTTLHDTYDYFEKTLGFLPQQAWDTYAYGIALGGLELDLVTLTHAFSALANDGVLQPLIVGYTEDGTPQHFTSPHSLVRDTRTIAPPDMIALVNAILTDRTAGVEQFGQKGSLHLSHEGYAVKTGTSRDYHDSWTVGYTGDFVVGVWAGNTDNRPMHQISGAMGAGSVWRDVMELMFTTPYFRNTKLNTAGIVQIPTERGYSFGLPSDDIENARSLLLTNSLILFPHERDVFLYTPGMRIPLQTTVPAEWEINSMPHGDATEWFPTKAGVYTLRALTEDGTMEEISLTITNDSFTFPQW